MLARSSTNISHLRKLLSWTVTVELIAGLWHPTVLASLILKLSMKLGRTANVGSLLLMSLPTINLTAFFYSLPQLSKRSEICQATQISNPGCYATAAQLIIAPMLDHIGGEPVVFGVPGYFGADTRPSPKYDINIYRDSLIPYRLTGHTRT